MSDKTYDLVIHLDGMIVERRAATEAELGAIERAGVFTFDDVQHKAVVIPDTWEQVDLYLSRA